MRSITARGAAFPLSRRALLLAGGSALGASRLRGWTARIEA